MTDTIVRPAVCPDWVGHRDLYAQRESTWRLTPDQKRADWAEGCGWCAGAFSAASVAEQYLTPDVTP